MDCKNVQEKLSWYIDGYSDDVETKEIEAHLLHCTICARELEELRYAMESLRQLPEIELPPNFKTELNEKLLKEDWRIDNSKISLKNKIQNKKWLSWGATAAIVVLMLLTFDVFGFFVNDLEKDQSNLNLNMTQAPALEMAQNNSAPIAQESGTNSIQVPEANDLEVDSSVNEIDKKTFKIMSFSSAREEASEVIVPSSFSAEIESEQVEKTVEILEELAQSNQFKDVEIKLKKENAEDKGVTIFISLPEETLKKLLNEISAHYKILNLKKNNSSEEQQDGEEISILELHIKNSL